MKMFGMCFNWKVLAGLAAVGVALFFIVSPQVAVAALPLLLLAACPLSMVLMMVAMKNMNGNGAQGGAACAMGGQGKKLSHEEQLAQLKAQQAELASQIAALDEAAVSDRPAMDRSGNAVLHTELR